MSRLTEWVRITGALGIVWYLALNNKFGKLEQPLRFHVQVLPIYLLIVFGIVSVLILISQVVRIKNCDAAHTELKNEIEEARTELKKKGFEFD